MEFQGRTAWEVAAERRREVIAAEVAQHRHPRKTERPTMVRKLDLAVRSLIVALTPGR